MAERSTNVLVVGGGSVGLCMSMELGSCLLYTSDAADE